jgi:hypothetical protein
LPAFFTPLEACRANAGREGEAWGAAGLLLRRLPLGFRRTGEGKGRRWAAGTWKVRGGEEDRWPKVAGWRRPEGGVTGDGEGETASCGDEMLVSSSLVRSSERKSSREAGSDAASVMGFPKRQNPKCYMGRTEIPPWPPSASANVPR